MIILGVDPGTLITGIGIIKLEHSKYSVIAYDIVRNQAGCSMPARLKKIYDRLCEMIKQYHPDEFAIETAFYGKNAQSALKIGQARGVSILAAVNFDLPTSEYSPREIKKAVTGNGTASKRQVQFMVKSHLKLQKTPGHFDISDALAVAVCHSFRRTGSGPSFLVKKNRKMKPQKSWSQFILENPERIARKK
jgi:crossover junction endodeoxyribonuclease RuvC